MKPDPSDDEIRFAKQRRKIWHFIIEKCDQIDRICETGPVEVRCNVDSLVGSLQGHTLSGQQMVMMRKYLHVSGEPRSFEVSIGHTGENWEPVVTVLDEGGHTYSLQLGEAAEMDLSLLRADLYRRIEACSGK